MRNQTSTVQGQITLHRVRLLPIFGARIQFILTNDIRAARQRQEHLFGPVDNGTYYNALCSRSDGHNFALFFEPCGLTHRIIAHEVFHLTHRILEWVGVPFTCDNHEVFAALNGDLHQWVMSLVKDRIQPDGSEWSAENEFQEVLSEHASSVDDASFKPTPAPLP